MLTFDQVVDLIRKESEYSKKWAKGGRKLSKVEGVNDEDVHTLAPLTGYPYSISDFQKFAKKYWKEADLAQTNYTPDGGAVRIRLIKVINLLVRALMVHGREDDIERLAGHSSNEFPIINGGLDMFDLLTDESGNLRSDFLSLTKGLVDEQRQDRDRDRA